MNRLEDKVLRFIQTHGLFQGTSRVLLAVSGGADSMALLHIMHDLVSEGILDLELDCVHINHQLRGADSDGDETFVVEQATRLNVPVTTQTIDVATFARTQKLSIETAARQQRLACLSEVGRAQGCSWIATGHQLDDNAETVLQRLHRGTGFRGLAGIWPMRQLAEGLTWARPLLGCTRAEIVAYLRSRNLAWREDHTNADCVHTRNYIRHRLLPSLQNESTGPLETQLADLATSAYRLHLQVARQAQDAAARCIRTGNGECTIDAKTLAALPEMVAVELLRGQLTDLGCRERNLTQRHYGGILELATSPAATKAPVLPGRFLARKQGEHIILSRPTATIPIFVDTPLTTIAIPGTTDFDGYRIEASIVDATAYEMETIKSDKDSFLEYLDLDLVAPPLIVRPRRQGDRFQPLGLAAEKKVGKFLTATRVPERTRRQLLIFEDDRRIVWVCPVRISECVKATSRTRRLLALRVTTACAWNTT